MTFTGTYGVIHETLADFAARYALTGVDIRVLLAIHEEGGEATSATVERVTRLTPSAVRRASLHLRQAKLITADAGVHGSSTKPGVRSRYVLTRLGHRVGHAMLERILEGTTR